MAVNLEQRLFLFRQCRDCAFNLSTNNVKIYIDYKKLVFPFKNCDRFQCIRNDAYKYFIYFTSNEVNNVNPI